jgi:murein DD-endopeptidase MepM/ murein hydrolase activator NlpD
VVFAGIGDALRALAPIPLDSSVGVTLRVACTRGDTVEIRIPTMPGDYTLEPLRVAPRFTAPPSAALAERIRREAERAALVATTSRSTPPLWRLPFLPPRASRITSAYGRGRVFNGTVTSRHMGTDCAGPVGAAVRATNRGVVRLVDRFYLAGNVIYVDHGGALVSAYLHLSRAAVRVGDTVSAGTVVGYVGATGRVTGPHLHFALRFGSISVDPTSAFTLR